MPETHLEIRDDSFLINGQPVYSEIPGAPPAVLGLMMNARFIQGIFDDAADPSRFARFGRDAWDAQANTDRLIAALPAWRDHGLRAFTVGFQGGGPCYTTDNDTIVNNPYGSDGTSLDAAYARRMDRLIRGADRLGMCVIVSFFYGSQTRHLADGKAVRNAVATAANFLAEGGYTNVFIEVANEHNVPPFGRHPILFEPEGMAMLIDLAREQSGGLPVGCSSYGNWLEAEIAAASDVVLIHGNGCTRGQLSRLAGRARTAAPNRPVVCNEDSPCLSQLPVAVAERFSWGYYNNITKQEPPADWGITPGDDTFFALRMAMALGIDVDPPGRDEQYVLQGIDPRWTVDHQYWPRLASLYPETVDHVEYFDGETLLDRSWDEPFFLFTRNTWMSGPWVTDDPSTLRALVHLRDGSTIERTPTDANR